MARFFRRKKEAEEAAEQPVEAAEAVAEANRQGLSRSGLIRLIVLRFLREEKE